MLTVKGKGKQAMTRKAKTPFDSVTSQLGALSRPELVELAAMVAALLDDDEADEDKVETGADVGPAKAGAKGHVEAKVINGCGPYLYLRYWSGKTLKSKYIGKANKGSGS